VKLQRRLLLEPEDRDPAGSFTGWYVAATPWLVDASARYLRTWDVEAGRLIASAEADSNGGVVIHPRRAEVLSVHETHVAAWTLPDLRRRVRASAAPGPEPAICLGSSGQHVLTLPRVHLLDVELRRLAGWREPAGGEPFLFEAAGWVADSRCRAAARGVDIRSWIDGTIVATIAGDAPVTHLCRVHEEKLWLFQEEGRLDVWDVRSLTRVGGATLHQGGSLREDFQTDCVVCVDLLDPATVVTLGSDGVVRFWTLPSWSLLHEHAFEMTPAWIDAREPEDLAVGFFEDRIETFRIFRG